MILLIIIIMNFLMNIIQKENLSKENQEKKLIIKF